MSAIVLNIEDKQLIHLQAIAKEMNMNSVEDLLLKIATEMSNSRTKKFEDALKYVLAKNKELYKHLA